MKSPETESEGSSESPAGRRSLILLLLFVAMALRLAYFASSEDNPLLYSPTLDEAYYINLGKSIAEGYWLGENRIFFMDPLYGYLLGLVFMIFGDNLTLIRLLQIVVDSLNVALIFSIGSKVWSRRAGLVAAVLYAVYKVAFFYSLLILKTTLTVTASLVFVWLLINTAENKRGAGWWLSLGLLAATMTYLRANLLLMAPLGLLFYFFIEKPDTGTFLKQAALFTSAMALALSIGAARNYWVSGELALLNTQTGRLLYASNNPQNLTGRYNVPSFSRPNPEDSEKDFHKEAERRLGRALSVKEVSRYWTGEAIRFLLQNPSAAAALLYNKIKGTVGDYEIPNNQSFYLARKFSEVARLPLPTFAFVFALGVPGLLIGLGANRKTLWLLAPVLTTLATVTIFYTSSRFRFPAVPFLMIGAGICVDSLLVNWRKKRAAVVASISAAVAVLFFISVSAPRPEKGSGTEEYYLAKAFWRQNRLKEAWDTALKSAEAFPNQARFQVLLGMTALSASEAGEAERRFLAATRINPKASDAYHNLGLARLALGRYKEAIDAFNKALSIDRRPGTLFAMAKAYESLGNPSAAARYYRKCASESKPSSPLRRKAMERLKELSGQ